LSTSWSAPLSSRSSSPPKARSTNMAVQLDDDDDMKFSAGASSYKENEGEGSSLLPARELEFREYLCDSKAVDEVVRLLVGLAETPGGLPENPVANWRAMYDAELEAFKGKDHLLGGLQGPTLTSGRAAEDIPALLDENDQLRARDAELSAKLHEVVSVIEAKDAEAAAVVIDALVAGGAFASAEAEDCLDVGKLYAAVSARFPAPAEEAETPQVWAAEGATVPEGVIAMEGLKAWAKATWGYGATSLPGYVSLNLFGKAADAAEENIELDEELASGIYAACVALASHVVVAEPTPE